MRLSLRVDGAQRRHRHLVLFERVATIPGVTFDVGASPAAGGLRRADGFPFRIEAVIAGNRPAGASARVRAADIAPYPRAARSTPELVLDLCGDLAETTGCRLWRLTFDDHAGEAALLSALRGGRSPVAALTEGARVIAWARRRAARYSPWFEDALVGTITLIVAALTTAGPTLAPDDASSRRARSVGRRRPRCARCPDGDVTVIHRLYRAPHWRVGWRHLDGADVVDLRAHPEAGWRDLPDDGHGFQADPFPVDQEGRTILFVEDYQHARGKAVISAVAFGRDGPIGAPVPVLDEPYHLSYPFVFHADGAQWMIPESGANRTVDLDRATDFPAGWVREATLLSGLTTSDATLVEHAGRWWMFTTVREIAAGDLQPFPAGSFSDALYLRSAPNFRGPWTPHARNPVMIDIAAARPAGRIVARGTDLIRPVQDCRLGYGDAVSLAIVADGNVARSPRTVSTKHRSEAKSSQP